MLFGLMWLLPFAFMLTLMPVVASWPTESRPLLWARVLLLVAIAWFWIGLVLDQIPCFLGVPNCD